MAIPELRELTALDERRRHRYVRRDRGAPPPDPAIRFEEVADLCPAGIVVILPDGRIEYTNRRAETMLGLSPEQYRARDYNAPAWAVTDFDDRPLRDDELIFSRIMATGQPLADCEHAVTTAAGMRLYMRVSGQPVKGADGSLRKVIFTMMDVSHEVAAERARREADTRYRDLIDNLSDGVVRLGADCRTIVFVNPRVSAMLGYSESEMIGKTVFDFVPEPARESMREKLHGRAQGVRESYETQFRCKDGALIEVNVAATPLRGPDGRVVGSVAALTDVTGRRRAEQAREEMRLRHETTLSALSEGVILSDADGHPQYCNARAEQILKRTRQELVDDPDPARRWVLTDEAGAPIDRMETPMRVALRDGVTVGPRAIRMETPGGDVTWLMVTSRPLFQPGDVRPYAAVTSFTDVSELKRIELALRHSERQFATALELAPIGMALVTLDGHYTLVNEALCRIVDYPRATLETMTFQQITHPDDLAADLANMQRLLNGEIGTYQMEKRYLRRGGDAVWTRLSRSVIRDAAGAPLHFIVQIEDIDLRKRAADAIAESEERLRLMLDGVLDYGITMLDTHGLITRWSVGAERLKGYSADEIVGQHFARFYTAEDLAAGVPDQVLRVAAQGRYEGESWYQRKDGSQFWANTIVTPVRDADGVLRGFCKITQDVTEQRATERRMREREHALEAGLVRMRRQNREVSLLSELSNLLQSCLAQDELTVPVRRCCRELFPGAGGALYLAAGGAMQRMAEWGAPDEARESFPVHECWALRRGQFHAASGPDDLRCGHEARGPALRDAICVPMIAQGELMGLLHLQFPRGADPASHAEEWERKQHLGIQLAERIGMAMANVKLRETLRAQSIRDPLTQLYNRRFLAETLQREAAESRRRDAPLALLLLDIDHFKAYNDTHGHEGGDAALLSVARVLQERCRASDMVCRYGGEEFVVVMPGTTREQALDRAEALRRAIQGAAVAGRQGVLPGCTVSIGLAMLDPQMDPSALLDAADGGLYEAKRLGRNRVVAVAA